MMWQDQALTCTACNLQLYSTDKSCLTCGTLYCASCYSLKAKLDSSSSGKSVSTATIPCQSCQNLIKLKKQSKPTATDEEDANRVSVKPSEDSYGSDKPVNSNSNTSWQTTRKNDLSAESRHNIVPIQSQAARNVALSTASKGGHHIVPIQSQTARNNDLSATSRHQIVSIQPQTGRNKGLTAASKGGRQIVPVQSGAAMTNDFDAVDEDAWEDMEDEDTLVTNIDLTDIYDNTPYALVLCGLVNPEELEIQILQKKIVTLQKQKRRNDKRKEIIQTQSKSKLADAHQEKSGKNSGTQNMGRHLFSEFSKGNKGDQSGIKSMLKDSTNFPDKGINTKASSRNHNETFGSSAVHNVAMQESWNDAKALSQGDNMSTKMNVTMRATNKTNLEASFRSNIDDGTSMANRDIDSSDYGQGNEYQAQVPYNALGNSSSDSTSNWPFRGKLMYPTEAYSASVCNIEDQPSPRASDQQTPRASDQQTLEASEQQTSGAIDKQTLGASDQQTLEASDHQTPGASEFSIQYSVSSNSTSSVKQKMSIQMTAIVPNSQQQVSSRHIITDSTKDMSETGKEQGEVPWNIGGSLRHLVGESNTTAESVPITRRELGDTKSETEEALRNVRQQDNRYSDAKDLPGKVKEIKHPNFIAGGDIKTSRELESANKYRYAESAVEKTKPIALGTQTIKTVSAVEKTKLTASGKQTYKTESAVEKTKPKALGTQTVKTESAVKKTKPTAPVTQTVKTESAVEKTKSIAPVTQTVKTESAVEKTKPIALGTQTVKTKSAVEKTKPTALGTQTVKTEHAVEKTKPIALGTQTIKTENAVEKTKPTALGTQTVKTERAVEKTKPSASGTFKTEGSRNDKRNAESPSSISSRVNSNKNTSDINKQKHKLKESSAKRKAKQTKKSKKGSAFFNQDAMEKYDFDEDEELDELHDKPYALSITKGQLSEKSEAALSLLSFLSPSTRGTRTDPGEPRTLFIVNLSSNSPSSRRGYKNKNANRVQEIPFVDKKDEKVDAKPDDEKTTVSFQSTFRSTLSPAKDSPKKNDSSTSVNKNSFKNIQTENKTTHSDTAVLSVAAGESRTSEENTKKNQKPGVKSTTVLKSLPKDSKAKASVEKERPSPTKPAPVLKLHKAKRECSLEEKYYMGFLRLKERQTNSGHKCSSCGRPECQGENMLSMRRLVKSARENGFQLQDVSPDGNCMFAAIVDQLAMYGDHRFTTQSLRQAAVKWLEDHPYADGDTPRSAFLSEDWWQYIDRMTKDGQWGDHVILEAIVEVIGCTVRVMSPGEKEIHWTQLEPRGEGALLDDRHLVLGHVGEFHYTSLRPTAIHVATPGADVGVGADSFFAVGVDQEETEEDQLVAMFREDYMDKESDLPVAHLSYLLKTIMPTSLLDEATICMSANSMEDSEEFAPSSDSYSCKLLGPVSEGIHVPALDETVAPDSAPIINVTTTVYIRKDIKVVSKDGPAADQKEYVLEQSEGSVYTKLFRKSTGGLLYAPDSSSLGTDIDSMKNEYFSKYPHVKLFTFSARLVSFECNIWPESASAWKTRLRYEAWPGEGFIQSVIAEGCLIIQSSQNKSGAEWEFFFGLIEKRLFREIVSQNQRHGFIMFKTLCRQALQAFDKVSQVLKSIFFYACEVVPADLWESNTGACVMHMLEQLHKGIQTNSLPHYFIPAQNMLAKLAETDLEQLREDVNMLRMQPLFSLGKIQKLAMVQFKGNEIMDLVVDDIPNFIQHRSVRQSNMDAFLPATILIAKENIRLKEYLKGYEILSKAYEERLAISTCDDTMSYQMFLAGALGGLDLKSTAWFSAYADKILQGQLSRSLIQEVCSDLPLAKIGQLLPADVAGEYSDIEVPMELFQNFGKFCLDFAKFLYKIEKMPAVLPVMYHCFERYKQERKDREGSDQGNTENKNSLVPDVEDGVMLELFTGMAWVYERQGQIEFFRGMIPDIKIVCERIDTRDAYQLLLYFYSLLRDKEALQSVLQIYEDKFSFRDASGQGRFLKCMSDWSQGTTRNMNVNSFV